MYSHNKILCIIPARGGSKGLPGKNIKELAGKPLIGYTIEHAKQSKYIDRIIVSTESEEIARISKDSGAEIPFMRPLELAGDDASTIDVLLHAIDWMENVERYSFDMIVLLHITTPLRKAEDIDNCIELMIKGSVDNVFSVSDPHRNPYFNMVEITRNGKIRLVKKGKYSTRQSAPQVFDMNSSIYAWWKDVLKKKKGIFLGKSKIYVMPKERSIDIDDDLDFRVAEFLIQTIRKEY